MHKLILFCLIFAVYLKKQLEQYNMSNINGVVGLNKIGKHWEALASARLCVSVLCYRLFSPLEITHSLVYRSLALLRQRDTRHRCQMRNENHAD